MFQGFTDETFEFFMAIAFNNNTDFFHDNRDWYLRAVREPCLQLAEALSDAVEAIDPELERRPNRVVSRINRDLRFSRDKTPYRDHMWLSFHRTDGERHTMPGFYFEITVRGGSCGMGLFEEGRPRMNALRRRLISEPDAFLSRVEPLQAGFDLHMDVYKRMKPPEGLRPALASWYPARSFYFDRGISDMALIKSPELVGEIARSFARLAPLYHYICALPPEDDADQTRLTPPRPSSPDPI